jgi:hypothetical protein
MGVERYLDSLAVGDLDRVNAEPTQRIVEGIRPRAYALNGGACIRGKFAGIGHFPRPGSITKEKTAEVFPGTIAYGKREISRDRFNGCRAETQEHRDDRQDNPSS